jgi:hypothetical protein
VADRSPELVRQALQLLMCLAINPYTRRLHANQHTASGRFSTRRPRSRR